MTTRGKLALTNSIKLRKHRTLISWIDDFETAGSELLKPTQITPSDELARGNFGAAFKALFKKKERCILKVGLQENKREALFESMILQIIPPHENLCEYFGIVNWIKLGEEEHETALVLKEYTGGSLKSLVEDKKGFLNSDTRFSYFKQMASVMKHLQHHGMIHRDLALRNFVLTDDQLTLKLIDFGLSYFIVRKGQGFRPRDNDELPYRIHPPESLIAPHEYFLESDIWLLGIAFWETYHIRNGDAFFFIGSAHQQRDLLLTIMYECMGQIPLMYTNHVSESVRKLINSCCSFDYKMRPSPEEILVQLDEIQHEAAREKVTEHDNISFSDKKPDADPQDYGSVSDSDENPEEYGGLSENDENPEEYGGLSDSDETSDTKNKDKIEMEIGDNPQVPEDSGPLEDKEEKEPAYYLDWKKKKQSSKETSNPYAATYGEGYITIQEYRESEWTDFERIIHDYRQKKKFKLEE